MSIPQFPEIDPEMNRDRALDMILVSIAMEELGLSHIINAEGEKLQYVLSALEKGGGKKTDIDKLLCVNQSISNLLEIVSQNQMLLKNKLDKTLGALPHECACPGKPGGCPTGPTGPTGSTGSTGPIGPAGPQGKPGATCPCPPKCSAVFKGNNKCETWQAGCALPWNKGKVYGKCICRDPKDITRIMLCSKRRYVVSLVMNINNKSMSHCDVEINLQLPNKQHDIDLFVFKNHIPCSNTSATVAMSGILIDDLEDGASSFLIRLKSPKSLIVENSMLCIVEV